MDLSEISFGDRVAENESERLANYFVKTQQWNELYDGKKDIIFGSKGAGKSALYTLLLNKHDDFRKKNIILLSVEKPTGRTVFSDISNEPPTDEKEFITLWKIYFCQLIITWLIDNDLCKNEVKDIADELIKIGLIEEKNTLKRLVNSAKEFAKALFSIESLEGGVGLEDGITGKITFKTPTREQQKNGYKSVDELLDILNSYLIKNHYTFWLLCDRLDVAFDQSLDLEKNALRALFKVYRDIEEYQSIEMKIFLRDDIWNRITKEGFREASHITKTATISWNAKSLLNLIVTRSYENPSILEKYQLDTDLIKNDHDKQVELYYLMFPKQVDVGERQSDTFEWVLSRIRDGLGTVAPRELIHYYNESITQERKFQEISNNNIEEPNIVSRQAIKNASIEVSRVRVEQTIFAEYNHLKGYIIALENNKAEHNLESLSKVWSEEDYKTKRIALELAEIGFFDSRPAKMDNIYKIPFIYRFYLGISQGKAF